MLLLWIFALLGTVIVLGYKRASLTVWTLGLLLILLLGYGFAGFSKVTAIVLTLLYLGLFTTLNVHYFRRLLISNPILKQYRRLMPSMSATEKAALESGGVTWEGELFSGMPDWEAFSELTLAQLSEEERAFLEGPVEKLCQQINAWELSKQMKIPPAIWERLKSDGYFGMIIPKTYGGKGFSALGHAQVILKLASASIAVGTVASVPNSLGPGELLLRYGTEEQKNYYLPRLASGEEVPCFALTSPVAGSDAGSLTDSGIICRANYEGQEQLCLRLNWDKRYITLSPIATLIGLAFKCYDPEHLLGDQTELGITCALIPANLPGVTTGRRHFPLHSAFPNGPTQGHDVIIPLSAVIGGQAMIGQGWRMLMECLAAGRAISLPSMVGSNALKSTLASGAYAKIRNQFNASIAEFEGIQQVLARMAGYSYAVDAMRHFSLTYLNEESVSAVASAICKAHATEMSRQVITDAMDIQGGKAICMGPSNYLAQAYIEAPIGITVEGANILTRSLMIYGQGALRCHPYLFAEMQAATDDDQKRGAIHFDQAFMGHLGFMISNKIRSFCLGISNGRGSWTPKSELKRYYQLFSRFSAAMAYLSDATTILIGAKLKRKEMLSARLGDLLSYLYIGSAVLKRYESSKNSTELPAVRWICQDLLYRIQTQMDGIISNLPNKFTRFALRIVVFPRGKNLQAPSDRLTQDVAKLLTEPSPLRDRFAESIYYTPDENNIVGRMEVILKKIKEFSPIEKRFRDARRKGELSGYNMEQWLDSALQKNVLNAEEVSALKELHKNKMSIINVDDFAEEEI